MRNVHVWVVWVREASCIKCDVRNVHAWMLPSLLRFQDSSVLAYRLIAQLEACCVFMHCCACGFFCWAAFPGLMHNVLLCVLRMCAACTCLL